jgi:hypothetical protein
MIGSNTVIIMDNALYYSVAVNKSLTSNSFQVKIALVFLVYRCPRNACQKKISLIGDDE